MMTGLISPCIRTGRFAFAARRSALAFAILIPTLAGCRSEPAPVSAEAAVATLRDSERAGVEAALANAGGNRVELSNALATIEPEMRPGIAFLLASMPERDRTSLTADFLVGNTRAAYEAWRGAPWGHEIPEQMFLQYILPYANLNERRDDWRGDFARRFQADAWKYRDPMEAVKWLNDHLNDAVGVHYHASKRKKPDQSPYESIELHWASCTGLSILLVDACRAAGIPARCVGCPAWKKVTGNHTWVEVFGPDAKGRWRWFNVGDTGSDPRGENWVNERCRDETDPNDWTHAVWAACWRKSDHHFPLPWEWEIEYVPGLNVTRFYQQPVEQTIALPRPGAATVEARWQGELVARSRVDDGATEAVLHLARGERFEVVVLYANGTRADIAVDVPVDAPRRAGGALKDPSHARARDDVQRCGSTTIVETIFSTTGIAWLRSASGITMVTMTTD